MTLEEERRVDSSILLTTTSGAVVAGGAGVGRRVGVGGVETDSAPSPLVATNREVSTRARGTFCCDFGERGAWTSFPRAIVTRDDPSKEWGRGGGGGGGAKEGASRFHSATLST